MQPRSSSPMVARLATALVVLAVVVSGGCSDDEVTFCGAVREYNEAALSGGASIHVDSSDSEAEVEAKAQAFEAAIEGQLDRQRRLLDDIRDTAPPAIRDDIELLVDEALAAGEALRAADFDIFGYAGQHQLSAAEAEERTAANRRVNEHTEQECGEALVIAEIAAVPDVALAEIRDSLPAVPPPPAPADPPPPPDPPSPPPPAPDPPDPVVPEPEEPEEPDEPSEPEEPVEPVGPGY